MKELTLRRSSSEKKLAKEKKKERKEKSKSVHFDGNGKCTQIFEHFTSDLIKPGSPLPVQPISIIGDKRATEGSAEMSGAPLTPADDEMQTRRNNKFMWTLKVELI